MSARRNVLFLAHRIPYPPDKGDKIRSWRLLRHLSKTLNVHLGCFVDDPDDFQHVDTVRRETESAVFIPLNPTHARLRSARALLTDQPLSFSYYDDRRMHAFVKTARSGELAAEIAFSSSMAPYIADAHGAPRIVDLCDADSEKWRDYAKQDAGLMRGVYAREGARLAVAETKMINWADAALAISDAEAAIFGERDGVKKPVLRFANGVDVDYFAPRPDRVPAALAADVVFVGAMDYRANIDAVRWFSREVWPQVRKRAPEATLAIVGARPDKQVSRLHERDGIVVVGKVDDVRPHLQFAHAVVAPMKIARGVQNKVLEAMAMARPVALSIVSGAIVWNVARRAEGRRPVARLSLTLPSDIALADAGLTHILGISSDGARVVYASTEGLYLRAIDRIESVPLPGTEGATSPFFSPNGEWVGFWSEGQIKKAPVAGGAAIVVCDAALPYGAVWDRGGDIVFGQRTDGILRVSSDGGVPEVIVPLDESDKFASGPQLLPDGKAVLYTLGGWGAWDDSQIVVYSLESGERKILLEGGRDARYVPTGHLTYVSEGSLVAVPFDPDALALTGGRVPLAEKVMTAETTGAAQFSISDSGTLFYLSGTNPLGRKLVWVDRSGNEEPLTAEPRAYVRPRISPNGDRVAVDVYDDGRDIWIWDLARETLTRLTLDPSQDMNPEWTSDGSRVAFSSRRDGQANLYQQAASGTGEAERLTESESPQFLSSVASDGRMLFAQFEGQSSDIAVRSRDGSIELLLGSESEERMVDVSPDERWIAYESDASGQPEIYVRPFPNVEDGQQWLISRGGGSAPLWAPDGRELFYTAPGSRLMAVSVQTVPDFVPGDAVELFRGIFTRLPGRTYDISPDGKRFLMVKESAGAGATEFVVVMNWFGELERLVP